MNLINDKIKKLEDLIQDIKEIVSKQDNNFFEQSQIYNYSKKLQHERDFNKISINDNNKVSLSEISISFQDNYKIDTGKDNIYVENSPQIELNEYENKYHLNKPSKNMKLITDNSQKSIASIVPLNSSFIEKRRTSSLIDIQDKKYNNLIDQITKENVSYDKNYAMLNIIIDDYNYFSINSDQKENISFFKIKNMQIPHDSLFTLLWNCIITTILLFFIVVFPFERFSEPWLIQDNTQIFLNLLFEQFFIIDIFINFFTSYRDNFGKIVSNIYQISYKYFVSQFILDLLSSIPTNNLFQYNIIQIRINNSLLKILKIPKQLRVFRGFNSLHEGKFVTLKNLIFYNMSNTDFFRVLNSFKYGMIFIQLANILACLLVSFVHECEPGFDCYNWFYSLVENEFQYNLNKKDSIYHQITTDFQNSDQDSSIRKFQNHIILYNRRDVYMDAWYFVFQTVTTVGYGDISTFSTQERFFRSFCMIFGVIIYTILSAQIMDSIITESLDIYRRNEHVVMIEKLQLKYSIQGESRSFLGMLGDSVYTEPISKEIEFINLLPTAMGAKVLKSIWNVQYSKLYILEEENFSFFLELMRISSFRRCIVNEVVDSDNTILSTVQSGQIGVQVPNLNNQLNLEYLYYIGVGEEFGFQNFLKADTRSNFEFTCIICSEIIEVKIKDQVELVSKSLKGFEQLFNRTTEQLMNLQMVVSMQNAMIRMGLQIEYKWYRKMMSLMKFGLYDHEILYKIYKRFISNENDKVDKRLIKKKNNKSDWYDYYLEIDSWKQILSKSKQSVELLMSNEKYLNIFKKFVKNKGKIGQSQTNKKIEIQVEKIE